MSSYKITDTEKKIISYIKDHAPVDINEVFLRAYQLYTPSLNQKRDYIKVINQKLKKKQNLRFKILVKKDICYYVELEQKRELTFF